MVALALVIPLAAIAVIAAVTLGSGSGSEPPAVVASTTATTTDPEVAAHEAAVATAYEPTLAELSSYLTTADEWRRGERSDGELRAAVDRLDGGIGRTREAVEALVSPPSAPLAVPVLEASLEVLAVVPAVQRLAIDQPPGSRREQLDRSARRLRTLADRLFDRARELTSGPLASTDDVILRLPAEVPDWPDLDLTPGPPLAPEPRTGGDDESGADELDPSLRRADRPSQPERRWLSFVDDLGAPASSAITEAGRGDPAPLGIAAGQLDAAARTVHRAPVPDGDRNRADRLALGLLVRAEAARLAQWREPALDAIVGRLLAVSDATSLAAEPS